MKGLIKDLGMAAQVFGKAREARKQGAELRVQETVGLPVYKLTKWGETMEWALFQGEADRAARKVFYSRAPETQRALTFTPKEAGGWLARARFWSEMLRPALPPKMYHEAMIRLCSWYRHCIHMRKRGQE